MAFVNDSDWTTTELEAVLKCWTLWRLVERMMHCTIVLFFQLKKVKYTNQGSKTGASHLFGQRFS